MINGHVAAAGGSAGNAPSILRPDGERLALLEQRVDALVKVAEEATRRLQLVERLTIAIAAAHGIGPLLGLLGG